MHQNFDIGGGVVLHLFYVDFALVVGSDDGLDERASGHAVGNVANDERAVVQLFDVRPNFYHATAFAIVVAACVDESACRKIGQQLERFVAQNGDRCVEQLVEVVRHNFRVQAQSDAFATLRQQQRKLHWQENRLLVAPVVRWFPRRCFGIEHRFERKFRQSRLDVTGCRRFVARENVAPVTLAVDKQIFLTEIDQRRVDRGVAVWVVVHGVAHNGSHLVVATIVGAAHGVQHAALHRLQAVVDVRNGTVEVHIRGVVEKPHLVHARQMAFGLLVLQVGAFVVGMSLWCVVVGLCGRQVGCFSFLNVIGIFGHFGVLLAH